jgi:hypothetical protein
MPYTSREMLLMAGGVFVICLIVLITLLIVRRRRDQARLPSGQSPVSVTPFLESLDGRFSFPLATLDNNGVVVGKNRLNADVTLPETLDDTQSVSDAHARIYYESTYDCVIIENMDSANGILVNGRRAPRKNVLKDRWLIGLGNLTLVYRDGESDTGPLD